MTTLNDLEHRATEISRNLMASVVASSYRARQADQPPGAALARGEFFKRADGVGACGTSEHDFRHHHRQADDQRGQQVDHQKAGTAVGSGQIGKFPDVAKTDGRTEGGSQHAEGAGETVAPGSGMRHGKESP